MSSRTNNDPVETLQLGSPTCISHLDRVTCASDVLLRNTVCLHRIPRTGLQGIGKFQRVDFAADRQKTHNNVASVRLNSTDLKGAGGIFWIGSSDVFLKIAHTIAIWIGSVGGITTAL